MEKRNKKHTKRVKRLVLTCALCAIILTVSTYAWFIGMMTVNVSSFDVTIAAIDGLSLSLDGNKWTDTVEINGDSYNDPNNRDVATPVYAGNTNSWGGSGLIPMSSVGDIDAASSKMILFEKGSLTTTPGGYRLMASKVENATAEKNGYVAFDLFVKNLSGTKYYSDLNKLNEEAIFLTTDSEVKVSDTGGVTGTGIENSVRVAFAQIGRVVATTTTPATITGITCKTEGDVTGICADRVAQIWEPNDTKHVANATNWYNTSCKKRTATVSGKESDVTLEGNYSGTCSTVTDGTAYPTYAVSGVINYTDNVDAYDGTAYNGYTGSISTTSAAGKLVSYDYFTDTEKMLTGTARPTFITLAPNSITKIRIYVYIEGQDIDNYDFASLGKQISVQFGFTKERFVGTDIEYDKSGVLDKNGNVVELPTEVQ